MEELKPCPRCGKQAKIRYKMPYTWIECKKKCGMKTGYYADWYEQADLASRIKAIAEWNSLKDER